MEASPQAQGEMERLEAVVEPFLRTRTQAGHSREGILRELLVGPVATVADTADYPQLAFREYFQPVDDPGLGGTVRFPGPCARLSATPLAPPRRAPAPVFFFKQKTAYEMEL